MKYLKCFESYYEITNESIVFDVPSSIKLNDDFVEDIKSICYELNDIWPTIITVYTPDFRKMMSEGKPRENTDYPCLNITEEKWRLAYSFQEESKEWTKAILEAAIRIKDYLGDNYIMFGYVDNDTFYTDINEEFLNKLERWNYKVRMRGIKIVFNPKDYLDPKPHIGT